MTGDLHVPMLLAAGGELRLAIVWYGRGKAQFHKSVPLRLAGGLMPGEMQFVSGPAHSPVKVAAPSPPSRDPF